MENIYSYQVRGIDGQEVSLEKYRGQVLLIVNVASKCGFTPQYEGLEALHKTFRDKGFAVLGFPCNQFGGQEPGDEPAIQSFCSLNYDVTFPLFAKVDVNGAGASPLFQYLCENARGVLGTKSIKWNFTKFLVNREGQVQDRYASTTAPKDIAKDIAALLDSPK